MVFSKKVSFVFFVIILLTSAQSLFASAPILNTKISIEVSDKRIGDVLSLLEKRINVHFVYVSGTVDLNKKVSFSTLNSSLEAVLRQLIPDKKIQISAKGNSIIFSKTNKTNAIKRLTPKPKKDSIQVIHDTLHLVVKDTVLLEKTDTVIVIKFDTIYKQIEVEKQATPKSNFSIGVFLGYEFVDEKIALGKEKDAVSVLETVTSSESISTVFCGGLDFQFKKKRFISHIGLGLLSKKWNIDRAVPVLEPAKGGMPSPVEQAKVASAGYLNIPMSFNYMILDGSKMGLYMGGGPVLNVLLFSKGSIYVSEETKYDLLGDYLHKSYVRANVDLGAIYNFSGGNSLDLKVSYSLDVTPQFTTNYLLKRDEQLISLSLRYYWAL